MENDLLLCFTNRRLETCVGEVKLKLMDRVQQNLLQKTENLSKLRANIEFVLNDVYQTLRSFAAFEGFGQDMDLNEIIENNFPFLKNDEICEAKNLFLSLSNYNKYSMVFKEYLSHTPEFSIFSSEISNIEEQLLSENLYPQFLPNCFAQIYTESFFLNVKLFFSLRKTIPLEANTSCEFSQFLIHTHIPSPDILSSYPSFLSIISDLKQIITEKNLYTKSFLPHLSSLNSLLHQVKTQYANFNLIRIHLKQFVVNYLNSTKKNFMFSFQEITFNTNLQSYLSYLQTQVEHIQDQNTQLSLEFNFKSDLESSLKPIFLSRLFETTIENIECVSDLYNEVNIIHSITQNPSLLLSSIATCSGFHYYEQVISYLKDLISENEKKKKKYEKEIQKVRTKTNFYHQQIELYENKQIWQCEKCFIERNYVLTSCGHTFCDLCYQTIIDSRTSRCPFCGMPFLNGDVMKIQWKYEI